MNIETLFNTGFDEQVQQLQQLQQERVKNTCKCTASNKVSRRTYTEFDRSFHLIVLKYV